MIGLFQTATTKKGISSALLMVMAGFLFCQFGCLGASDIQPDTEAFRVDSAGCGKCRSDEPQKTLPANGDDFCCCHLDLFIESYKLSEDKGQTTQTPYETYAHQFSNEIMNIMGSPLIADNNGIRTEYFHYFNYLTFGRSHYPNAPPHLFNY